MPEKKHLPRDPMGPMMGSGRLEGISAEAVWSFGGTGTDSVYRLRGGSWGREGVSDSSCTQHVNKEIWVSCFTHTL